MRNHSPQPDGGRPDGRDNEQARPVTFTLDYVAYPEGSVLVKTRLDLCYAEDREADVDMNLVMTQEGRLIEVQGPAEGAPFSRRTMDRMLDLGQQGIHHLIQRQKEALAGYASGT